MYSAPGEGAGRDGCDQLSVAWCDVIKNNFIIPAHDDKAPGSLVLKHLKYIQSSMSFRRTLVVYILTYKDLFNGLI